MGTRPSRNISFSLPPNRLDIIHPISSTLQHGRPVGQQACTNSAQEGRWAVGRSPLCLFLKEGVDRQLPSGAPASTGRSSPSLTGAMVP